jgi:hypothetical protein
MDSRVGLSGVDDLELTSLARDGDPSAIRELWTRHYPVARAVARRVAGQTRDAEDIASDAWISSTMKTTPCCVHQSATIRSQPVGGTMGLRA